MKVYYSVYEKFNIKTMEQEHKDIVLGEALAKLEVIKNLIDGEANETYRTIDVKTLQAVLGYYPEALKSETEAE